jgi:phenylacetate-coenzyme A ligase PaaK-like adenylate-forming protein
MKTTPLDEWIKGKIEYSSIKSFREELDNYTIKKLNENIEYAKSNSRFYRNKLSHISNIKSFEEFEKVSFTLESEIRNDSNQFLCVSQSDISRIVTLKTSGTTGKRKRIFFTKEDQELTIDFFKVGMSTLVQEGDRVLILMPGQAPGSIGDLLKKGLERINVKAYIHGPVNETHLVLDIIEKHKINSLVGIPVQVFNLARFNRNIKLKSVLLSTDYVPEIIKDEIEKSFNCRVFNHYGMTEMGLGGGVECKAFKGYHLREGDLCFEIINPKTGTRVQDGEWGEVVFTTLTRKGMPLIRYRTGDISRFIPKKCTCGTELKVLDKIQGRFVGKVNLFDDKYLLIKDLDEKLFMFEGILDYFPYLVKDNNKTCLIIKIKTDKLFSNELSMEVLKKLRDIPVINYGIKIDKISVPRLELWKDYKISSGMVKREIHNYIGSEINGV